MFVALSPCCHQRAGGFRPRMATPGIRPADRRVFRVLAALTLFLAWAGLAPSRLAVAGTPYNEIPLRNAFGLHPPAPVTKETPHAPLPKVHLTGITTILKGKRALLKVEFPAKPPERPKEVSYILQEGQREGPIQVLAIDEKHSQVKLNNSGTITNITFEKIAAAPAPPPARRQVPQWTGLPYRSTYHR